MRTFMNVLKLLILSVVANSALAATTVIDVLAVYTKGAADTYGGDPSTRINHLFQFTNQIYADSNLDIEIRLVKTMMVDYTDDNTSDSALRDITFAQHDAFVDVEKVREQVKADMVIFYRPFKSAHENCGHAWILGGGSNGDFSHPHIKKYMYSHIPLNSCGDYATAHELGHNMGLRHSRRQDGSGEVFPFALGHGVDNQFATIMAYQTSFNVDYWIGKVYKFSSPELECKGVPCGVDASDTVNGADARLAISITAPQIAGFYSSHTAQSASSSSVSSMMFSAAPSSVSSVMISASSSSAGAQKPANNQSSGGGGGGIGILFITGLLALFFISPRIALIKNELAACPPIFSSHQSGISLLRFSPTIFLSRLNLYFPFCHWLPLLASDLIPIADRSFGLTHRQ